MNLSTLIGDTPVFEVPLTWGGAAFVPGEDWTLIFTAKRNETDPDDGAAFQKASGAGLTVTDSTATITLVSEDTVEEVPANLYYDIQAQHLTDGRVRTVAIGRLDLQRDITRATTVSVPIHTENAYVARGPKGDKGDAGENGTDASVTNANVVAAIQAGPAAVRTASQVQALENWVFEGDSWTAGIAQSNDRETYPYYIARLAPQYGVNFYNVATAGQTAATMVSTFAAQVSPYLTQTTGLPSTAFILAGINDAATRTTTQLRDDLRSLWTSARNAGARVVAFTLPHRTAVGGWSQADWKIINDQIIADSSYYDFLVRTDIIFNNALSSEFSDNLHVTTAAHKKLAGQVWRVMNGGDSYPSLPSDLTCSSCTTAALAGSTTRMLPFAEAYDANSDATTATVGSDSNVRVFTCPVDGTYEVSASLIFGTLTAGDLAYLSAYVTPVATGSAVEHRLGDSFDYANGPSMGSGGKKRFRLLRGDKIHIGAITTRAGATILSNTNFTTFQVRLVSIP